MLRQEELLKLEVAGALPPPPYIDIDSGMPLAFLWGVEVEYTNQRRRMTPAIEKSLLEELASSSGNILENVTLLTNLDEAKAKCVAPSNDHIYAGCP